MGQTLIFLGIAILIVGILLTFAPQLPFGRLPGDFSFNFGSVRIFAPIATSIVISLVLTIVLNLLFHR